MTNVDKRRRAYGLMGVGIAIALIGLLAPFFNWYVLMHATCSPSDDLCGLINAYLFLFVSIPCLLLGLALLVVGLLRLRKARGSIRST